MAGQWGPREQDWEATLREALGLDWEKVWGDLCRELGGSWVEGGSQFAPGMLQVRRGDTILSLDTYTVSADRDRTTFTRLRAPFVNHDRFHFRIYRPGGSCPVGDYFEAPDHKVGIRELDRAFVLQSNDVTRLRSLCHDEVVRAELAALPEVCLNLLDYNPWSRSGLPEGVEELRYEVPGVIRDLPTLHHLFRLFQATLERLEHMASEPDDRVMRAARMLMAPGGQARVGKAVIWDGDPPRRRAAEALGQGKDPRALPYLFQALNDADGGVRSLAVWSLGEIGDHRAIPQLVPLLGVEQQANPQPLVLSVAEALTKLGEERLAKAFRAALRQPLADWEPFQTQFREASLAGFGNALTRSVPEEARNAALALRELGGVEHRKSLQDAARYWQTRDPETHRILRDVLDTLQNQSKLPRPAAAPTPDPTPDYAQDLRQA
ncbi:MAG: HEAT repeat domain-containing protein [SAR202 cluster bacterium]|nr:HEAT repeat domain-containing protein [SAR202 cluster bacterium]